MVEKGSFNSDYKITFIKMLSILYVTVLYAVIGLSITYFLDKYVFKSDKILTDKISMDKMNLGYVVLSTALIIGFIGVVGYIGRNLIQKIPFYYDGKYGFEYMRVKEVASGGVLLVFLIAFSQTVIKKHRQIKYKLNIN